MLHRSTCEKILSPQTQTPPTPTSARSPGLPSRTDPACPLARGSSCQSLKKTALQDSCLLFTRLFTPVPESVPQGGEIRTPWQTKQTGPMPDARLQALAHLE